MERLVLKFGGTSVADIKCIENAAEKVIEESKRGYAVAVVVSAMSGTTNELINYCREISPLHDAREYDAVVSSGENITAGLLALAIQKQGIMARSWQGWQIPIECNDVHGKARILNIDTTELEKRIDSGEVAVVTGFQGITAQNRVTTLGRGGSDTSAVALAAALHAIRCDIYTDVPGVFTANPQIVSKARKMDKVSFEEMLEMASLGAKVLQTRSVEMAMKNNVTIQVLSSFDQSIGSDLKGTLVTREEDIVEQEIVNGITYTEDEAKITLTHVPDKPGMAARIFGPLARSNINVDMIVQNVSQDGESTDVTFTVMRHDLDRTVETLKNCDDLKDTDIHTNKNIVKVSVVGIGMKSHAGVALKMFDALSEKGINIDVISTSEIKISVLIAAEYAELAVRTLHSAYGLDK